MAVLTRDEFFESIQSRVGTDTSDDALKFVEDMTDTYNTLEQSANGDGIDWKERYDQLDASWREKYRHRFFTAGPAITQPMLPAGTPPAPDPDERATTISIDDLFT